MATVKAYIRTSKKSPDWVKVRFRLVDGRNTQLYHASEIEVDPAKWDSKNQCYKARALVSNEDRAKFNRMVSIRKNLLNDIYNAADKETLTSEKFETLIDQTLHPEKYRSKKETLFDSWDIFMDKKKVTNIRYKNFTVIKRILKRYELFTAIIKKKPFELTFEYFTPDTLEDYESFIRNEHILYVEYPEIYKAVEESRTPEQRGHNRIVEILKKTRTFLLWAKKTGRTQNNPFENYSIPDAVYGTPVYINIKERNKIYKTDFSLNKRLETQRDIFVFQSLIGCRVGDLLKFTPDNIIDEALEYIPRKTKEGRPVTVRVPLNDTAKEIIDRYKDEDKGGKLLPFVSEQKYNKAIKEIFKAAKINRMVTVLDPKTGEEVKRPINEIASSHMARKTFIGNLYKRVKDPNLVGSLSGHKEGSKAFARYRDIDDDIKKEVIKYLD